MSVKIQAQGVVESLQEVTENDMNEYTSTIDVFQNSGSGGDIDEGKTRNRSRFPEHPERFIPMPIPDPTNKPHKTRDDNPEVPENHTIKKGALP